MGAGLYLHIPFCRSKCGYCAFNSIAASRAEADNYLDILAREINAYALLPWSTSQTFTTVFIGGGTPSLASPEKLAEILNLCRSRFTLADQAEISMEANPDSIDQDSLTILRQAGINRLSIGVQSFNDTILKSLNRAHTGDKAIKAFETARKSGVTNINIDLIYGLPGQSLTTWQDDLVQALALAPEHLALYELTIEPDTPFARQRDNNKLTLPDEDLVADMEEATAARLSPTYQRYEISNYARPGYQCLHNMNYWQNGSYLGLGAGAVSCFDGLRVSTEPDPHRFMDLVCRRQTPISHVECLSPKGRFRESMIMGLRLLTGVNLPDIEDRFGLTAQEVYGNLLADFTTQGLLIRQGNMIRIAANYLAVANQILSKLV
ncbi:MAG: radical SAM family heme chaperone HemW [Proteobacteria bacterium]|nr:radical SAM family heme chaperone HemW [Pseudomonadota bacterium]MBU1639831.1 radical SAM family heme chaperone HemW [Pseudomonadota bacterium]